MNGQFMALSHCPTPLEVGTMGQRTAETGRTKRDKRDKETVGTGALVFARRSSTEEGGN
jgi:hypothetical protein